MILVLLSLKLQQIKGESIKLKRTENISGKIVIHISISCDALTHIESRLQFLYHYIRGLISIIIALLNMTNISYIL